MKEFFKTNSLLLPILIGFAVFLGGLIGFATDNFLVGLLVGCGVALAILGLSIGLWVLYLPLVALHELGHLVAGKMVGFQFQSLTVGPLEWQKRVGRTRFYVRPGWIENCFRGGTAGMVPVHAGPRVLLRHAWFILGGPLASLAVAVLLGWAAYRYNIAAPPDEDGAVFILRAALSILFLYAAGCVVWSIVPGYSSGYRNDGGLLVDLMRRDHRSIVEAWLHVTAQWTSGVRARDWDPERVRILERHPDDPHAWYIPMYHHLDLGNYHRALENGESSLLVAADWFQGLLLVEVAYLAALEGHESDAEKYLAQGLRAGADKQPVTRALAALRLAQGRSREAQDHIERARTFVRENNPGPIKPNVQAELDWLDLLEQRTSTPPPSSEPEPGSATP